MTRASPAMSAADSKRMKMMRRMRISMCCFLSCLGDSIGVGGPSEGYLGGGGGMTGGSPGGGTGGISGGDWPYSYRWGPGSGEALLAVP